MEDNPKFIKSNDAAIIVRPTPSKPEAGPGDNDGFNIMNKPASGVSDFTAQVFSDWVEGAPLTNQEFLLLEKMLINHEEEEEEEGWWYLPPLPISRRLLG